jgi:hypothetical protein
MAFQGGRGFQVIAIECQVKIEFSFPRLGDAGFQPPLCTGRSQTACILTSFRWSSCRLRGRAGSDCAGEEPNSARLLPAAEVAIAGTPNFRGAQQRYFCVRGSLSRAHIPWWSAECGNNTRSAAIPNKHQTGVDRCLRQALVPSERSSVRPSKIQLSTAPVDSIPRVRGKIMNGRFLRPAIIIVLVQRFRSSNHIDIINQPRPEERALAPCYARLLRMRSIRLDSIRSDLISFMESIH